MKLRMPHITITQWAVVAISLVVMPLFGIVVWQLLSLDPVHYCKIVSSTGVPPGDHCFKLLMKGLDIKGWVIWGSLATLAAFVIVLLTSVVRTVVAISGPGGWAIQVGTQSNGTSTNVQADLQPRGTNDAEPVL